MTNDDLQDGLRDLSSIATHAEGIRDSMIELSEQLSRIIVDHQLAMRNAAEAAADTIARAQAHAITWPHAVLLALILWRVW